MNKVIKIITSLIIALGIFLIGWLAHAWKNRKEVAREVKRGIKDLCEEHKKALENIRKGYEEQLKEKNKTIQRLVDIIDRVHTRLGILPKDTFGLSKLMDNLNKNKERLYNL